MTVTTRDRDTKGTKHFHPTAEEALEPYLRQLRKIMKRGATLEVAEVGLLLLFLADDAFRLVAKRLEPYGISEKKLDVLLLFTARDAERNPCDLPTPTSIADYMDITRASATGLLDWLETRGLIARKAHPTDRRSIQTEITASGRDLLAKVLPAFGGACVDIAASLNDRDRADLKRVLSKMWNHIKRIGPTFRPPEQDEVRPAAIST